MHRQRRKKFGDSNGALSPQQSSVPPKSGKTTTTNTSKSTERKVGKSPERKRKGEESDGSERSGRRHYRSKTVGNDTSRWVDMGQE